MEQILEAAATETSRRNNMDTVKVGDRFEDMDFRGRGKLRVVEVLSVYSGRAVTRTWIDGKNTNRETTILVSRLLNQHKARQYKRLKGKFLEESTPKVEASEPAADSDPADVGPLRQGELEAYVKEIGGWRRTNRHARFVKNFRQLKVALELTLEDLNRERNRSTRLEAELQRVVTVAQDLLRSLPERRRPTTAAIAPGTIG
jgi:hypothetical protein